MGYTKKALIRDPKVPQGQPAALHVICECKQHVPITGKRNVCVTCGTVYDDAGWIKGHVETSVPLNCPLCKRPLPGVETICPCEERPTS